MSVAAIDIGTNAARLLVAKRSSTGIDPVLRTELLCRLGEGLAARGELSEVAIWRTLAALTHLASCCEGVPVEFVGATEAVRRASNGSEFVARAEEVLGTEVRVLTGEEEGRFAHLGATWDLAGEWSVIDVGGGSVEISSGLAREPADVVSLPLGSVVVTETLVTDLSAARHAIVEQLTDVRFCSQVCAVGATPRIVGELVGDETAIVSTDSLTELSERLFTMTTSQIEALGVEPRRADVLAAGVLVLRCAIEVSGCREWVISDRDLLDGMLLDDRG